MGQIIPYKSLRYADIDLEIMDYTAYKARIFPPESYIEECESWDPVDDWHSDESESSGRYHPSYTLVYKTARNVCAKQRKITDRKRDATSISLALQRLPNLTELALEFGERTAEVGWAKSYLDLMTMDEKSFEHHIQVASAALISANDRCVPIQKVQLIDLSLLCDIGPRSQETHSLTISLAKLVKSAPSLQLLRSRSTLSLLCHTCLDIRQLHSCNTILERDSLEKFLRTNVKSLHSISIHDVEVLERHWSVPTKLTPALIRDTIGIPVKVVKRLEPFSCPCLFREGWKLLINQYDSSSVPNALKRKRDA
jgi:hypothetical protein